MEPHAPKSIAAVLLAAMLGHLPARAIAADKISMAALEAHAAAGRYLSAFVVAVNLPASDNGALVEWTDRNWKRLPSAILYAAGNRLFITDKTGGLKLFYLGRLRVLQDVDVCTAERTTEGVIILDKMAEEPLRYGVFEPKEAKTAAEWALARDAEAGGRVSPAWNCLIAVSMYLAHKRQPPLKTLPKLLPESEWPAIRAKIRDNYVMRQTKGRG